MKYPIKKFPRKLKKILLGLLFTLVMLLYNWLAEAIYQVRLPVGGQAELYSTELNDDLSLTISKAIDEATSSVTLIIYALSDPKVMKSLKDKADAGYLVKVICDAEASPNLGKLGHNVKILKRFTSALTHTKLLIIDEKQVWLGSANMTRASLRQHGNLVMAINSEPLALMASAKARSFTENKRLRPFPHQSFPLEEQTAELWFLPDDPMAIMRLKKLIQSAEKTIRIAMFTWTRYDLAQEVIAAHQRGIKVEVALDQGMAMGAGEKATNMLKEGGVDVRLSKGPALLHHKFMIVDDHTLVNGSANWTLAAFKKNDDCFLVLTPLTATQQAFLNRTWEVILQETTLIQPLRPAYLTPVYH